MAAMLTPTRKDLAFLRGVQKDWDESQHPRGEGGRFGSGGGASTSSASPA